MNEPRVHPIAAAATARDQAMAREFQKTQKRDWWLWGYSIFVLLLVAFAVSVFFLRAVRGVVRAALRSTRAMLFLVLLLLWLSFMFSWFFKLFLLGCLD